MTVWPAIRDAGEILLAFACAFEIWLITGLRAPSVTDWMQLAAFILAFGIWSIISLPVWLTSLRHYLQGETEA